MSLPIDPVRLCFEPKFLNDEKSFEDLLDGSTPDAVVPVSDAVLFTVKDEVGGTFGGEASTDDEDDEEGSSEWLVMGSVGGVSSPEGFVCLRTIELSMLMLLGRALRRSIEGAGRSAMTGCSVSFSSDGGDVKTVGTGAAR